jgi:hypothetical protein
VNATKSFVELFAGGFAVVREFKGVLKGFNEFEVVSD